jgi:hypothetical protein
MQPGSERAPRTAMRAIVVAGIGLAAVGLMCPRARAQASPCQDEEATAQSTVQSLASAVDTVKKETESDFESKYHQKSLGNKLTFAVSAVDGALQCLDKATGDPAAAGRKDAESKLKDKLSTYRTDLKAKTEPKAAKALIATFDLPPAATQ